MRKGYAANPEPIKAQSKATRLAHPERTKMYDVNRQRTRPSRVGQATDKI